MNAAVAQRDGASCSLLDDGPVAERLERAGRAAGELRLVAQ